MEEPNLQLIGLETFPTLLRISHSIKPVGRLIPDPRVEPNVDA